MTVPNYITLNIEKKNNLNFLRLLVACMVMLRHSIVLSGTFDSLAPFFSTPLNVYAFFIISGFLIIYSYWRSDSLKTYAIKRCRRLFPAYYFVIVLSILGLSFFSNLGLADYFKSPQLLHYFFANSIFLNFLEPDLPGVFTGNTFTAVNGALWTIKIMVAFYLIIPLISLILNKLKTKKQAGLFLAGMYAFGVLYESVLILIARQTGNEFFAILAHQLPGFLQYFAIGLFAYLYFKELNKIKNYLILPALGIFALYYFWGNEILLPIGLCIVVLVFAFNFPALNKIATRADYSYGIYLFHFPVIQIFVARGYFESNKFLSLIAVFAIVFLLSFFSFHLVEKRALKLK